MNENLEKKLHQVKKAAHLALIPGSFIDDAKKMYDKAKYDVEENHSIPYILEGARLFAYNAASLATTIAIYETFFR